MPADGFAALLDAIDRRIEPYLLDQIFMGTVAGIEPFTVVLDIGNMLVSPPRLEGDYQLGDRVIAVFMSEGHDVCIIGPGTQAQRLIGWYPIQETITGPSNYNPGTNNRFGVPESQLFGLLVENTKPYSPERFFTTGYHANTYTAVPPSNNVRFGVNIWAPPASVGGLLTKVATHIIGIEEPGIHGKVAIAPGKAAFISAGGLGQDAHVSVISVTPDGASTDYHVIVDQSFYVPGMAGHTPFADAEGCFDYDGNLWCFWSLWDGGMYLSGGGYGGILTLRLNPAGAPTFSNFTADPTLNGTTHPSTQEASVMVGTLSDVCHATAISNTDIAVPFSSTFAVGGSGSPPLGAIDVVGLFHAHPSGGVTVEVTRTNVPAAGGGQPYLFLPGMSGDNGKTQLIGTTADGYGGTPTAPYPHVMHKPGGWVTAGTALVPFLSTPGTLWVRSWGFQEGTYGQWQVENTHYDPHDGLLFLISGIVGHPVDEAEAEADVLTLLGAPNWASTPYADLDAFANAILPTGYDDPTDTGITIWEAGDYLTDLESNGSPITVLPIHPDPTSPTVRTILGSGGEGPGVLLSAEAGAGFGGGAGIAAWDGEMGGAPYRAVIMVAL